MDKMQIDNALVIDAQEYLREHRILELFEVNISLYAIGLMHSLMCSKTS